MALTKVPHWNSRISKDLKLGDAMRGKERVENHLKMLAAASKVNWDTKL